MARIRRSVVVVLALVALTLAVGAFFTLRPGPDAESRQYDYGRPDRKRLPEMTLLNHNEMMTLALGEPLIEVESIAILVYDGFNTLEAIGPMVVFSELMGVKIEYVGLRAGTVRGDVAEIVVDKTLDQVSTADVLVVPGGEPEAMAAVLSDEKVLAWIRRVDGQSKLTLGTGYGSLLLGKAGLLEGRQAAAPSLNAAANLAAVGATHYPGRYHNDGKFWTSEGQTAAIDVALAMVGAIAGERYLQGAMLDLEYDPQPPTAATASRNADVAAAASALVPSVAVQEFVLRSGKRSDSALEAVFGPSASGVRDVGILVYEGFFTLDALGPLAVLSQLDGVQVRLVRTGDSPEVKSGRTRFVVPTHIDDVSQLDMLLVPGGAVPTWEASKDPVVLDWIRGIDKSSRITASVCTGAWILGSAGLLEGRRATTNWYRARQMVERYGGRFENSRYVHDGKYWTSAGVSAGLDMGFAIINQLRGPDFMDHAIDRLEYRPLPPIDAGSPEKTDDLVLDMLHQMYDYGMLPLIEADNPAQ